MLVNIEFAVLVTKSVREGCFQKLEGNFRKEKRQL